MSCPSDLHRRVRCDEDLAAAPLALRVGQRGLDLVDGVHRLDRRREDALDDLIAEVRVDRANLSERARGQPAAQDEADQRLPAADERAARHHRVLARRPTAELANAGNRGAPPAAPGRSERWGIEERHGCAGALRTLGDRGAPRLRRGAPNVGGMGAMSGPPCELMTRSPGLTSDTPAPTAVTRPTHSAPGVAGSGGLSR